jgi:hypothetical protein
MSVDLSTFSLRYSEPKVLLVGLGRTLARRADSVAIRTE